MEPGRPSRLIPTAIKGLPNGVRQGCPTEPKKSGMKAIAGRVTRVLGSPRRTGLGSFQLGPACTSLVRQVGSVMHSGMS